MNRRGFLKRAGALAVASAFPLPAEPALTFKGVPLVFGEKPDFMLVSEYGYREMEKVWKRANPKQCEHIFAWPTWFCIACGRTAEDILDAGGALSGGKNV